MQRSVGEEPDCPENVEDVGPDGSGGGPAPGLFSGKLLGIDSIFFCFLCCITMEKMGGYSGGICCNF